MVGKILPLLLLLCAGSFAQTATYTVSFNSAVQTRSFSGTAGNYTITNMDGSHTWFTYGGDWAEWVDFYEGSCMGQQYNTRTFTASTFDVVCDDGTTRTEVQGTFALHVPHECRYGICVYDLKGTSSITATPEELHSLGVPGY